MFRTGLILLFSMAVVRCVHGGIANDCASDENVQKLNTLATEIMEIQSALPPLNLADPTVVAAYEMTLHKLCTENKTQLDEIESMAGNCPPIIFKATELLKVTLAGKQFIQFLNEFADIKEFCDCSPYLLHAWILKEVKVRAKVVNSNGAFNTTTNLQLYCAGSMNTTVSRVASGLSACRPLPVQSGFKYGAQVTDLKNFVDGSCATFQADKLQCALNEAVGANFKQCIANPEFESDDAERVKLCGRRECFEDSPIERSCGDRGRDQYIDAVNLQRETETRLISKDKCSTSGATAGRVSIMAALATFILYLTL